MSESLFPQGATLVFGGSGGIGRVIARQFAVAGSDVAVTYRSRAAEGAEAAGDVEKHGRRGAAYPADVTDRAGVASVIASVEKDFGQVHTIVFAAGRVPEQLHISKIPPDQWRAAIEVETLGFLNVVHASLPHFRSKAGGSYVHISSAGQLAWANTDGLSIVPKAANDALVRGIAKEEGRFGIRANTVLVGIIEAGMFLKFENEGTFDDSWKKSALRNLAIKRWGKPEEVGDAAVFLASSKAAYITGQTLSVAGGYGL
jgi:NAD(P)-dependent dehydrogenase (short-subunit alcohol dehydrogenase family)